MVFQRACSDLMKAANASGVLPTARAPCLSRRSRTFGEASASTATACLSRSVIACAAMRGRFGTAAGGMGKDQLDGPGRKRLRDGAPGHRCGKHEAGGDLAARQHGIRSPVNSGHSTSSGCRAQSPRFCGGVPRKTGQIARKCPGQAPERPNPGLFSSTIAAYIEPAGSPAMEINGCRNKPFGPGGSTRRLHPSAWPRRREHSGGGETGSTRA
jgi:hypothetical protein